MLEKAPDGGYRYPGSNRKPSACWADVIATRPYLHDTHRYSIFAQRSFDRGDSLHRKSKAPGADLCHDAFCEYNILYVCCGPCSFTGVQIRDSIVVSISACHAEDPGSIPGRGVVCISGLCRMLSRYLLAIISTHICPHNFERLRPGGGVCGAPLIDTVSEWLRRWTFKGQMKLSKFGANFKSLPKLIKLNFQSVSQILFGKS